MIFNFVKDKIPFFLLFFLNTLFILLFVYSTVDHNIEFLYPIVISVSLIIVFAMIEFYRYYNFNKKIENRTNNPKYKEMLLTNEQRHLVSKIEEIHNNYMKEINDLQIEKNLKNRLLAQWVHNLKTPITVQDLIFQRINNNYIADEDLISLKNENNIILNNLQNLLNLIRLEEFSKDYMPTTVNLYSSINKVIKRNKNLFLYNNLLPKVEGDIDAVVLSDEKWNEFIIEQVVSNAIKYSSEKNSDKHITFKIERISKTHVTLKIIDEGIGIPNSDIERVLEPFFTGENGRFNRDSTGIGLYLCATIAKKLNHEFKITSMVGEGTTVSIQYLLKN